MHVYHSHARRSTSSSPQHVTQNASSGQVTAVVRKSHEQDKIFTVPLFYDVQQILRRNLHRSQSSPSETAYSSSLGSQCSFESLLS